MEPVTFEALLSAAGAGIAAGIITAAVSLLRTAIPLTANWNGATMAFVGAGVLYALAGVATGVNSLDAGLGVFIAFLTCGAAAVAGYELVTKPVMAKVNGE